MRPINRTFCVSKTSCDLVKKIWRRDWANERSDKVSWERVQSLFPAWIQSLYALVRDRTYSCQKQHLLRFPFPFYFVGAVWAVPTVCTISVDCWRKVDGGPSGRAAGRPRARSRGKQRRAAAMQRLRLKTHRDGSCTLKTPGLHSESDGQGRNGRTRSDRHMLCDGKIRPINSNSDTKRHHVAHK